MSGRPDRSRRDGTPTTDGPTSEVNLDVGHGSVLDFDGDGEHDAGGTDDESEADQAVDGDHTSEWGGR